MKKFEQVEEAISVIDTETTKLGERVTDIQKELADAHGDETRVAAAASKLSDVAARLRAMATPAPGGGVTVPVEGEPVADGGGSTAG